MLDTNFLIYLGDERSNFHERAVGYFEAFSNEEIPLFISSVSAAEYLVKGRLEDLPLDSPYVEIIPFNLEHAEVAGIFARTLFKGTSASREAKPLIWNDVLILAQAEWEKDVSHFLTSDKRCIRHYEKLKNDNLLHINLINFTKIDHNQLFSRLF